MMPTPNGQVHHPNLAKLVANVLRSPAGGGQHRVGAGVLRRGEHVAARHVPAAGDARPALPPPRPARPAKKYLSDCDSGPTRIKNS